LQAERRAVARYKSKLAVQVEIDDYKFDAISMEVSLLGLRVVCEGSLARNLFSRYLQVTPGENVTAKILINIPNNDDMTDTLKCMTRVVSVHRISQRSYVVGFNIVEFDDDKLHYWENYISLQH
jgi:hypothetical protein